MASLTDPNPVHGASVAIVATLGIAVNGFSAWRLMANSQHDINLRAAFLHMALDAAVSLAVVIGGLVIMALGWTWIDPAISLVVVLVILLITWGLLRSAMWLALNAVPAHIDLPAVRQYLLRQSGVTAVEDLHIWIISMTQTASTAHLVMPDGLRDDSVLRDVSDQLGRDFGMHHVTTQIVRSTSPDKTYLVCGVKNLRSHIKPICEWSPSIVRHSLNKWCAFL